MEDFLEVFKTSEYWSSTWSPGYRIFLYLAEVIQHNDSPNSSWVFVNESDPNSLVPLLNSLVLIANYVVVIKFIKIKKTAKLRIKARILKKKHSSPRTIGNWLRHTKNVKTHKCQYTIKKEVITTSKSNKKIEQGFTLAARWKQAITELTKYAKTSHQEIRWQ